MTAKTHFFWIILKEVHPTDRKNVFWKIERYLFSYLSSNKNPTTHVFVTSLPCRNTEQVSFCCSLFLGNWAESQNYVPRNWGTSENFEKNEKWTENWHSKFVKNQSFSALFQRFSGYEQCWNRTEIFLNQSWSALNVSETATRLLLHNKYESDLLWRYSFITLTGMPFVR